MWICNSFPFIGPNIGWGCQSVGDLACQLISCFFSKSESNAALGGILNGSCPETDPLYR